MARLPRLCVPGIPQHIIQRGTNRQACFASVGMRGQALHLTGLTENTSWRIVNDAFISEF